MRDEALEVRRAIETEYACLSTAVGEKNLDAIRAIYAPDYRELQTTGEERDLAGVMSEWKGELAAMLHPSLGVEIDRLDLDGSTANVIARSTQAFASSPFPALRYSVRTETTRHDSWIRSGSDWKLRRSKCQQVKAWINDKLEHEQNFESPLTAAEREAVVRELGDLALPFKTIHAENGFADLAGLDRLIGNARIVALGEASHGTAEFFQMKHRLLEYLVETKGFTVFAIEGNWPEAQVADRYIRTGEGGAAAALAAMYFWTWQTEELRAMLDWMRTYNSMRGNRPVLSFTGFDMQNATRATERVLDILARAGGVHRDLVRQLYEGIEQLEDDWEIKVSAAEKNRFRDNATRALDLIEARSEALLSVLTPEECREVRHAAHVVLQATQMRADNSWGVRERAMADNVRWMLEEGFPRQKIVLWAHNGHVGIARNGGEESQGMHLRKCYGNQMVVLGFASHGGEVRAKRMAEGKFQPGPPVALPLVEAKEISVEGAFYETGLPRFILDFRRIPKDGALFRWLSEPRLHRSIGSAYDPDRSANYYQQVKLLEMYDGIIFIAQSTAAKPLK